MAKSIIGIGSTANDGTGDTLRVAGGKINDNFNEIYNALGNGNSITLTPTVTELNYVDGVTSAIQTQLNDKADSSSLADVATSGDYADLSNTPVLAAVATSGDYTDLNNAPVLADVATSGDYADLSNTPVLANVATSGDYADLSNTPAIPTASSLSVDDLISLSGVVEGSADLGTFTGSTIADSSNIKQALQALETSVETKQQTITTSITLSSSTSAPIATAGAFAVADGVSWDPAGKAGAVPYPVFYDGTSWTALY